MEGQTQPDLIHHACKEGDLLKVQEIINSRECDPNSIDDFENTVFMIACYYNHLPIIQYLKESGVNIHYKNNDGGNALTCACYGRHLSIIKYLIEECGMIITSGDMYTLCMNVPDMVPEVENEKRIMIFNYFLEKGIDIFMPFGKLNINGMFLAIVSDNFELFKYYLVRATYDSRFDSKEPEFVFKASEASEASEFNISMFAIYMNAVKCYLFFTDLVKSSLPYAEYKKHMNEDYDMAVAIRRTKMIPLIQQLRGGEGVS